jgi:hypothetical protein
MILATIDAGVVLPIAAVCGVLSMSLAQRNFRLKGVFPWKLHPAWWFAIGFLIGLVGVALCAIARATTKVTAVNSLDAYQRYPVTGSIPSTPYPPPPQAEFPGSYPSSGSYPPTAYPAPSAYPEAGAYSAQSASGSAPLPPAAWQPDPMHRHELRYWDGSQWTEHVSDSGTQSTDPL